MPKKKNKAALIGIAGGIAAAIALVIVLIVVFGKSSATEGQTQQQAADKYANGINTNNMQMVVDAIMPKEAADKLKKSEYMTTKEIAYYYGDLPSEDENISNVKIKVKGKSEDYYDADDLDDIKEEIEEEYDINVSEVEVREIDLSFKADGEQESYPEDMIFYKSDGKWYILDF
ncbi:MAG: hypothetical protein J1G06_02455 [Oscillospiraceae bacterium]|nr:hypothetical protein [Oscillospiraceae bacterium]